MYNLPKEVLDLIYEFDGRYRKTYKKVIKQINTINEWYNFSHTTLLSSIPNYYNSVMEFPTEEIEFYTKIIKEEFKDFYFRKHNIDFLRGMIPGLEPRHI